MLWWESEKPLSQWEVRRRWIDFSGVGAEDESAGAVEGEGMLREEVTPSVVWVPGHAEQTRGMGVAGSLAERMYHFQLESGHMSMLPPGTPRGQGCRHHCPDVVVLHLEILPREE
jgi:hypothetical protein